MASGHKWDHFKAKSLIFNVFYKDLKPREAANPDIRQAGACKF